MIDQYPYTFFLKDDTKVVVDEMEGHKYRFVVFRKNNTTHTFDWTSAAGGDFGGVVINDDKKEISEEESEAIHTFWSFQQA